MKSDDHLEAGPLNSTEHMKTEAHVEGTSQPSDDQLLPSHCSDSDTEGSDDWEKREGESALKSHRNNLGGQIINLMKKLKPKKNN